MRLRRRTAPYSVHGVEQLRRYGNFIRQRVDDGRDRPARLRWRDGWSRAHRSWRRLPPDRRSSDRAGSPVDALLRAEHTDGGGGAVVQLHRRGLVRRLGAMATAPPTAWSYFFLAERRLQPARGLRLSSRRRRDDLGRLGRGLRRYEAGLGLARGADRCGPGWLPPRSSIPGERNARFASVPRASRSGFLRQRTLAARPPRSWPAPRRLSAAAFRSPHSASAWAAPCSSDGGLGLIKKPASFSDGYSADLKVRGVGWLLAGVVVAGVFIAIVGPVAKLG